MGEVYRAEDLDLGRIVAIKVVKLGHLAGEVAQSAIQRFLQEAWAAAAITHPNVPVVYRVGVEAGWPYIVMGVDRRLHAREAAVRAWPATPLGRQATPNLLARLFEPRRGKRGSPA